MNVYCLCLFSFHFCCFWFHSVLLLHVRYSERLLYLLPYPAVWPVTSVLLAYIRHIAWLCHIDSKYYNKTIFAND